MKSPLARRKFIQTVGSVVAGGSIFAVTGVLARRAGATEASLLWQIDPHK
jgi:hypothetical protein